MTGAELIVSGIILLYAIALLVPAFAVFFKRNNVAAKKNAAEFISVIIPVRNEEENISACLESLAGQSLHRDRFEVIVVDDFSSDKTVALGETFRKRFRAFSIIRNAEGKYGKKSALEAGVNAAQGEIIAVTDGDCIVPPGWLAQIDRVFREKNPLLVTGKVSYKKTGRAWRHLLQAEQCALQIVSAGMMELHLPLLCSGANMAYRKDFFLQSGGYANDPYVSGDDVLLMQKAYRTDPERIYFLPIRDEGVETAAATGISNSIKQRARWISKWKAVSLAHARIFSALVLFTNMLLVGTAVLALANPAYISLFFISILGKTAVDVLLLSLTVSLFHEPWLLVLVPAGELVYPLLALTASITGLTGKIAWKDRLWKQ
jgi:poly-beta-1,6-N-acetyl-D-glucosamine synthase